MDAFAVTPADLVAQAAEVDRLGDEAANARARSDHVVLDRSAYGQLCQVIPEHLNAISVMVVTALGQVGAELHDTAHRLNLDDTPVSLGSVEQALRRRPVAGLKEILVVRDGQVIRFYPFS
jgi:hypothetical protein